MRRETGLCETRLCETRLCETRRGFGRPNRFFVELPLMNSFLASFSRQGGIQPSLCFVEGFLGSDPGAAGRVIRLLYLPGVQSDSRIGDSDTGSRVRRIARAACFGSQLVVGGLYIAVPARLDCLVQFVQSRVGPVCGLAYSALFKQPPEQGPTRGLNHQRLGCFDFGKFLHGASSPSKALAGPPPAVPHGVLSVSLASPDPGRANFSNPPQRIDALWHILSEDLEIMSHVFPGLRG